MCNFHASLIRGKGTFSNGIFCLCFAQKTDDFCPDGKTKGLLGYDLQVELSVVKEPSARLKKAIKEVENGNNIKCSNIDEKMNKLH